MATFAVIGVRKVLADDFSHRHIQGVCTDDHTYHPLEEVIVSIGAGHTWKTKVRGYEATIQIVSKCSGPGCSAAPYIETNRRGFKKDNLENLDLC